MTKTLLISLSLFTLLLANEPQTIKIIDKPIDFGKERIAMTKSYIKQHYGLKVNNIKITPKIIVLHWTAEMSRDEFHQIF